MDDSKAGDRHINRYRQSVPDLNETKVKSKGECIFGSVVGRVSGVVNGRSR